MAAVDIDTIEKLINRGDSVTVTPDGSVTVMPARGAHQRLMELEETHEQVKSQLNGLRDLLDTPEIEDFDKAVPLEAAHQVKRWPSEHDAGKNPEDWFWLLGYLAGKALSSFKAGDTDKAKHHCISAAAALRNWHAHIRTGRTLMRPGIEEPNV